MLQQKVRFAHQIKCSNVLIMIRRIGSSHAQATLVVAILLLWASSVGTSSRLAAFDGALRW